MKNNTNQTYYFLDHVISPYLQVTLLNEGEAIPEEFLGEYKIEESFETNSKKVVQLIKETAKDKKYQKYVIVFKDNDAIYTIRNIENLSLAKAIANSFSK